MQLVNIVLLCLLKKLGTSIHILFAHHAQVCMQCQICRYFPQVKRKGRLKRDAESKEKDLKQSIEAGGEKSKSSQSSAAQDSLKFSKDTREELDFQFDEELDVLPKTGRQHDFSEW